MEGGYNEWKRHRLSGIMGDVRPQYAGAVLNDKRDVNDELIEEKHITSPTIYRVMTGEIFKKPTTDSEKIIKISRPGH